MRSLAVFSLIFAVTVVPRAYAQAPACVATIMNALRDPDTLKLRLGTPVRLQARDSAPLETYALGLDSSMGTYFFYEKQSGQIIGVDHGALQWTPASTSGLPSLTINRQLANTCAVHSTFNCLRFLEQKGGLVDSKIGRALQKDRHGLFQELWNTNINADTRTRANELLKKLHAKQIQEKDLDAKTMELVMSSYEPQRNTRVRWLQDQGLKAELIHPARINALQESRIIRHLQEGKPAILDLNVRFDSKLVPARKIDSQGATQPMLHEQSQLHDHPEGAHSVLAIGYFRTGFFAGKVLVLDSATGSFVVWDRKELFSALRHPSARFAGGVTLVSPP